MRERYKPYTISAVNRPIARPRISNAPSLFLVTLRLYGGNPQGKASWAQNGHVGITSVSSMENLQPSFHRRVQPELSP